MLREVERGRDTRIGAVTGDYQSGRVEEVRFCADATLDREWTPQWRHPGWGVDPPVAPPWVGSGPPVDLRWSSTGHGGRGSSPLLPRLAASAPGMRRRFPAVRDASARARVESCFSA